MKVSFTEPVRTIFWDPWYSLFFNSGKVWEDLISNGRSFHILGPKNDKDSVP